MELSNIDLMKVSAFSPIVNQAVAYSKTVVGETNKITRIQLDALIVEHMPLLLEQADRARTDAELRAFSFRRSYVELGDKRYGVCTLLIIDGILKPMNQLEIVGGFQDARLSYLKESDLDTYYKLLDAERTPAVSPFLVAARALTNYLMLKR